MLLCQLYAFLLKLVLITHKLLYRIYRVQHSKVFHNKCCLFLLLLQNRKFQPFWFFLALIRRLPREWRSESWAWNPYQVFQHIAGFGACQPHPEIPLPAGSLPHHLPGANPLIREFSEQYGIPFEATRGGAETMYPEYQKKLKLMAIPRPKIFETKFAREHPQQ